jgi:branched-chain amino acid aminotransferase
LAPKPPLISAPSKPFHYNKDNHCVRPSLCSFPLLVCLSVCLFCSAPLLFLSQAADLTIERNTAGKPKPDPASLVFGKQFSDHMLTIYWSEKEGWKVPQIKPFQNLSLHPATSALHYSIEVREGAIVQT